MQTAMLAIRAAPFLQAAPRAADDAPELSAGVKGPPKLPWRVAAALTYLIPWIDSLTLGKEIYHAFPSTILLYFIPGRLEHRRQAALPYKQRYPASAAI